MFRFETSDEGIQRVRQQITAGVFKYEGNQPIDMLYACTDMLYEVKMTMGEAGSEPGFLAKFRTAAKAVQALEDAVKAATTPTVQLPAGRQAPPRSPAPKKKPVRAL